MSRGHVALHVGQPKTGTTFLQGVLDQKIVTLADRGIRWADVGIHWAGTSANFRAAVELRGSAAKFGLAESSIAGTWQRLCRDARDTLEQRPEAVVVLGHEVLGGAGPETVDRALDELAGLPVRVIVTARDLARQAVAHWSEEVKLGSTASFEEFERTQFRADTGPGLSPDDGGTRPHFWHAQDVSDTLSRWTRGRPVSAHLVTVPVGDPHPATLWRRFARAAGIAGREVDRLVVPDFFEFADPGTNPSLGRHQLALLRAVNAEVVPTMDRSTYLRAVKRSFAEVELAMQRGERPVCPAELRALFAERVREWNSSDVVRAATVHGDLEDLLGEQRTPDDAPPPDAPPPDPEEVARAIAEIQALDRPPGLLARLVGRFGRRLLP